MSTPKEDLKKLNYNIRSLTHQSDTLLEAIKLEEDSPPIPTPDPDPVPSPDPDQPIEWEGRRAAPEYAQGFLWKPVSEGDGRLVILLPVSIRNNRVKRIALRNSPLGEEFVRGKFITYNNGNRAHYRGWGKSGGAFNSPVYVTVTLTNSDAIIYKISNSGQRGENIVPDYYPANANGGGGSPPPIVVPPGDNTVLPHGPGLWQETHAVKHGYGLKAPFINCSRTVKAQGAFNVFILQELYGKYKISNGGYGVAEVREIIQIVKNDGWDAVVVDPEGQSWFERGHFEMVMDEFHNAGLYAGVAPKVWFDLTGRFMVGTRNFSESVRKVSARSDFLMMWSYGRHTSHIAALKKVRALGVDLPVTLIHDTNRWQPSRGYIGREEGEKLLRAIAPKERFMMFQPFYEDDKSTFERMNKAYGR